MSLAFLILPWAILGGLAYRFRGMRFDPIPRQARRLLFTLLLTIPIWFIALWWVALIVVATTMLFVSLGHGDWIDWGTSERTDPNEWLNPIVHLLTSKRDGPWHDFLGMSLSGMSTVLPMTIGGALDSLLWLVLLPLGIFKGLAYALGWRYAAPEIGIDPTVMGELLTGFFLCGSVGLLWWIVR